jgi:DNA-directed RNA polymerase subunit RPC12/RpoP
MGPRTSPQESTRENVCNKPLSSHQTITQKNSPVHTGGISNAGKFWSHREDKVLCARYDAGASIADMAIKHARTEGAITIRLVKLGKIHTGSEMDLKIRPKTRTRARPPVRPLYTKLPPKLTGPECVDCGKELFVDPSKATTNGFLCTSCSKRRLEMRNNISNKIQTKHKIITRRIDEGIAGTRDDHKKMRRWKLS